MIQAAINRLRTTKYHPFLPFSAVQAALESREAVLACATEIHAHGWNEHGEENLEWQDVADFLHALRRACPQIPVGISTGDWIVPDIEERLRLIEEWALLPENQFYLSADEDPQPGERIMYLFS